LISERIAFRTQLMLVSVGRRSSGNAGQGRSRICAQSLPQASNRRVHGLLQESGFFRLVAATRADRMRLSDYFF
jgi:hypothetical protein